MLILSFVLLIATATLAYPQDTVNYNDLYKFPFSIGFEYQNLSPFGDYGTDFNMFYDLSLLLRAPLSFLPVLQPLLQVGMIRFMTPDRDDQRKWQHTHWYGTLGIGYFNRFSKNFEIGVEIAGGMSEAIFPNLDPNEVRGSPNVLASVGARISLNPSYNISIDINPSLKYFHSLTPLDRFNGFVLGIGFSGSYRFGEDPDAPQAIIRSIKLAEVEFPPLFAAMQSYYTKNPFSKVTITNIESYDVVDVEVSFFQAGFMDTPTKVASIPMLPAGESRDIDIYATFNQEIFKTEGITPLTGEIIVDYVSRRKAANQTFSVSYDLHDKTALTWDDDRKVGAFITSADSALRNYSSFIRQAAKDYVVPGFSETLQIGMQVFYALKEIGLLYQVDPTSPFTTVQENPLIVDSISLPRDTLKRLTGDCDDLTVLYSALLETMGIETAFITLPGHIYTAFNTKVPSKSYKEVHPDKNMILNIEGELWVPVEITMIGTSSFLEAWRKGVEEFRALESSPDLRAINFTAKSQEIYRPVGLRETDLGLQYGSKKRIVEEFTEGMEKLVDLVIDNYTEMAKERGKKQDYNKLGIICARYGRYAQAQRAFNTALSMDRNYLNPKINLGNVFYMKEEYQNALRSYHAAEETLVAAAKESSSTYLKVLVNISRCYYVLENYDRASEYFEKAATLNSAMVERFSYLGSGEGSGRAADIGSSTTVLFADEEE